MLTKSFSSYPFDLTLGSEASVLGLCFSELGGERPRRVFFTTQRKTPQQFQAVDVGQ